MQQLGREREQMRLSFGQWKTGTANIVVINWVDMALQSFENHRGCNGMKTINTMWVSPPVSSSRPVPSQCVTTIVTRDIETQRLPRRLYFTLYLSTNYANTIRYYYYYYYRQGSHTTLDLHTTRDTDDWMVLTKRGVEMHWKQSQSLNQNPRLSWLASLPLTHLYDYVVWPLWT